MERTLRTASDMWASMISIAAMAVASGVHPQLLANLVEGGPRRFEVELESAAPER